jgi:hypothetical protein
MRRFNRYKYELPHTVVNLVEAVCADYDRRNVIISADRAPSDMVKELNRAVDSGLEVIEECLRRDMCRDIGLHRGYHFSPLSGVMSYVTYYQRKKKAVYQIAVELRLIS